MRADPVFAAQIGASGSGAAVDPVIVKCESTRPIGVACSVSRNACPTTSYAPIICLSCCNTPFARTKSYRWRLTALSEIISPYNGIVIVSPAWYWPVVLSMVSPTANPFTIRASATCTKLVPAGKTVPAALTAPLTVVVTVCATKLSVDQSQFLGSRVAALGATIMVTLSCSAARTTGIIPNTVIVTPNSTVGPLSPNLGICPTDHSFINAIRTPIPPVCRTKINFGHYT